MSGLKVSFATSVAGLVAAISTEVIERSWPSKRAKLGDPVADSLNQHMLDLSELIEGSKAANESVANNVAGMRSEMRDESKAVRVALEAALEVLAKGATEEIIQALQNVIKDFNRNLTEQFGENFKQLNTACLNLVEWQREFQGAVESATGAIKASNDALKGCREQFEAALSRKQEFFDVVRETGLSIKAIAALNDHMTELAKSHKEVISEFKGVLDDTSLGVTQLDAQIKGTVGHLSETHKKLLGEFSQVADGAQAATRRLGEMMDEHARGHNTVSENIEEVIKKLGKGNVEVKSQLDQSLKDLETALSSLTAGFGEAYRSYIEGMRKLTNPK